MTVVERFVQSMDDDALRHFLREKRTVLRDAERFAQRMHMIVNELEHEATKRGLNG